MKVALVAESFLPHTNGVTHSLLRTIDHLERRGDEAMVIAPDAPGADEVRHYGMASITRVPSVGWPGYRDVRVSLSSAARLTRVLRDYAPDVVHLASPLALGWTAVRVANELNLPTVAVYQTEVPAYAAQYGAAWGESLLWGRVRHLHERADVNLVPSTHAMTQLADLGVPRLERWGRGVDIQRFHPGARSADLRGQWAPRSEVVVGYVGRLAAEKRVADLAALANVPGISLVVVGDGPQRSRLESLLPKAHFTGMLGGLDLARAYASFDVFVHTGESETFGQTLQEAHSSGLPVVAPRRGGPVDLVAEGETGYLYTPGDMEALRASVSRLVHQPRLRARMGRTARASVRERTWDIVCDELMGHYQQAMARRSRFLVGAP